MTNNTAAKHAPGPWRKERNASPHSVYPYRIRRADSGGDIGESWHLADARLLEAAPDLERALRSLVAGVDDIESAWPTTHIPEGSPFNDMIGFLFATAVLARRALARIDGE